MFLYRVPCEDLFFSCTRRKKGSAADINMGVKKLLLIFHRSFVSLPVTGSSMRYGEQSMKILLISPIRDSHQFTNRGIPIPQLALIILHSPSLLPVEALEHASAEVIGEAEGVWEQLPGDVENNTLQRIDSNPDPDLSRYLPKDFSTLPKNRIGQSSICFDRDEERMRLAKKSGCRGLFVGMESVLESNFRKYRKPKSLEKTRQGLNKILRMGIVIQASVIYGLDDDAEETFRQTMEFLIRNRISIASINVLTFYPGTEVYQEFKRTGQKHPYP